MRYCRQCGLELYPTTAKESIWYDVVYGGRCPGLPGTLQGARRGHDPMTELEMYVSTDERIVDAGTV